MHAPEDVLLDHTCNQKLDAYRVHQLRTVIIHKGAACQLTMIKCTTQESGHVIGFISGSKAIMIQQVFFL